MGSPRESGPRVRSKRVRRSKRGPRGSGLSLDSTGNSSFPLRFTLSLIISEQPTDHRRIAPQALAEFLGRYLSPLTRCIDQNLSSLDPVPMPPRPRQLLLRHPVFTYNRFQQSLETDLRPPWLNGFLFRPLRHSLHEGFIS